MSKYDKEREALGIKPGASLTSTKSKYDNERVSIKKADENKDYADQMKAAYQSNPSSFNLPAVNNTPNSGGWNSVLDNPIVHGVVDTAKKIDKNVTAFQSAGANAMSFGLSNKLADHLGRQEDIASQNSVAGMAGQLTGDLVGIGKLYKVASGATKALKVGKTVKTLITGAAAGTGYQGIKEAVDLAVPDKNAPHETLAHRGKDIAESAALFAGGDIALRYAGKGIKAIADKTGVTAKLKGALEGFFNKAKPEDVSPIPAEQNQAVLGLPEPKSVVMAREAQNRSVLQPNADPIYGQGNIHTFGLPEGNYVKPTRLKVMNNEDAFLNVIPKVFKQATERMTPPLENESLLAKWVQGHLNDAGHDVSLNEVRGLNYEDLRQLSEEMRSRLNVQDVARKTAHDMGYGKIFDQTTPTVKEKLAKDMQSQVYGVPAPNVNIPRPQFNVNHVADAAMPETKVKFNPDVQANAEVPKAKPKSKYAAEREKIINEQPKAKEQPINAETADAIPTAEPRIRDKVTNYLDEAAQAARERLKAKRNTLSSNPIDQYADYAIIGASHLANGAVKFADFSSKMISDFGESIKPHLKEIFKRSKDAHKEAERQASGVAHLPGVNSGIDPLKGDKVDIMSLEGAIENSAGWKDKNRLLLNRETTERNFEDVMGKDAPIMNKTYIEPIQKAAADRQRFISQERSDIKDLGIKYKSPEDALVQKYGEGKMSELELMAASPKNWQKIKTAAETMRNKYDKYLDMANTVLKRNGYPEIPKRKDYFPHYEEIDGWMKKLGFGFEDNTLPADLNGITANLKPGKNFFSHALRRKTDLTTLGALAGHDRYIEGISKIIHQTDNIKRLRGLDKTLRETHEGTTHLSDFLANLTDYTNVLAGKKTEMDRSLEAATGRNLYSAVDWLKRRVGANMIGGSISSALTNSIPVTQLLAVTSKPSVLKGLTSALKNIKGDDFISQESNFLNRRFTSDKLAMGPIDKAQKGAGSLFKFIDHFTSNMVVRSKYFENVSKKGMPQAEALKEADKYATRMMGDRSEGSMPTLFHSRTFGLVTQFQLEVNNQLSHLFKDLPKSMSKAKYAGAISQVLIYDYLYNQIYEKITGNRPAFDPIGIAVHAVQDYTNPRISNGTANGNLVEGIANNLPFASVATGGRIPLGAALPNVFGGNGLIKGNAKLGQELLKPAKYLALPFGGSQINKTITGTNAVNKGEVTGSNSEGEYLKYPVNKSLANKIKGPLFGKNALSETKKYYDNNTPPLTAKETQELKALPKDQKEKGYQYLIQQKSVSAIERKAKLITDDMKMSVTEKQRKTDELIKQYNKLIAK